MKYLFSVFLAIFFSSCQSNQDKTNSLAQTQAQQPPNILWIVCEDISPMLSFYGDHTAKTPHLDALASESVVYDNAFAVVGVCGPSRSSIITGMYPTSIGTMHMRTGLDIQSWGKREYKTDTNRFDLDGQEIIQYSAVIPPHVKCFTEYLRKEGYFTTNNQKTDYQFAAPVTAWDENNKQAHWQHRKNGQPFFSVFNFDVTHESKIWKLADQPLTVDPSTVPVPPYFQDTEVSRKDIARVYSNIERLDQQVGELIAQLKEDGLYDATVIFFYSDHGGPLPRQKRELYESGLHVPFMVKGIEGKKGRSSDFVSFVDLAPTVLSVAGTEIPKYMQGKPFMGPAKQDTRQAAFGTSDRFDEFTDRSRTVYFDDYIYIQNDFQEKTWYKDVGYRKQVPMMTEMLELRDQGRLNDIQMKWFRDKPKEELYHRITDPHNLTNLAENPDYVEQLERGQKLLTDFRDNRFEDRALQSEVAMIKTMWPNLEQPLTTSVGVEISNGLATLSTSTEGASIAYIISNNTQDTFDFDSPWQLYSEPVPLKKGDVIYTIAERIGYKPSDISHMVYDTN